MNRDKAPINPGQSSGQSSGRTYKAAILIDTGTLKRETLKSIPKEDRLRDDAYPLAMKANTPKEYIYPYIANSVIWITPIEHKYAHLSADEVSAFYLKDYADPFFKPKDFKFYESILMATQSVKFDQIGRNAGEWAFSKAYICRIITPEQWEGDLYRCKLLPGQRNSSNLQMFNYFDYIKAWDGAFCYENRQKKHSWWIQFKDLQTTNFPQWFILWFYNWGLFPISMPHKVRQVYDDFVATNPSMKNHALMFTSQYQVPWIFKWDCITENRTFGRMGETYAKIPYLGRRIYIKWWDKYDFFKDSVFSVKGLIDMEPSPQPQKEKEKDVMEILKQLLADPSKEEIKKQIKAIFDSPDSSGDDDDYVMGIDSEMQESQDT